MLCCAQSYLTLHDPMYCSPPGFSVCEIFQAKLPDPTPRDLPNPGIKPASLVSPSLAGGFFVFLIPLCVR